MLNSKSDFSVTPHVFTAYMFFWKSWTKKPDSQVDIVVPTSDLATRDSNSDVLDTSQVKVDPAEYFKLYGNPQPVHDLRSSTAFVSCYDRRTRCPVWVIEHMTSESQISKEGSREKSLFKEDVAIPHSFRSRLADYFRSGYDRGHMVPAADANFSQKALDETFYLSNISPQVGEGFNRDYWAHFERFCRKLTRTYQSVRVVTGPLFLPQRGSDGKWRVSYEVIGTPPNVAVPTHFYKIVIGEKPISSKIPRSGIALAAFVLPNTKIENDTPLKSFNVPLDAVERAAGVSFLPQLSETSRRDLCKEVNCSIEVKEFKQVLKIGPQNMPSVKSISAK